MSTKKKEPSLSDKAQVAGKSKKGRSPSDWNQAARSAANKIRKLKGHMANLRKAHEARGTARAARREAALEAWQAACYENPKARLSEFM